MRWTHLYSNPAPLLPDLMPWDSQPAQASISLCKMCPKRPLVQGDSEAFVPLQPEMAPSQGFPNRKALVFSWKAPHSSVLPCFEGRCPGR